MRRAKLSSPTQGLVNQYMKSIAIGEKGMEILKSIALKHTMAISTFDGLFS